MEKSQISRVSEKWSISRENQYLGTNFAKKPANFVAILCAYFTEKPLALH